MSDEIADDLDARIEGRIDARLAAYRERLKYFGYGLGALFLAVTSLELITDLEILRFVHDKAFPPTSADHVGISYESEIRLRGDDPRSQTGTITFYALPEQTVKLYLNLAHRFAGEGEKRKVVVSVDGREMGEPIEQWTAGMRDISKFVESSAVQNPDHIHQIQIALDASQAEDLTDEITVVCVVLVYGAPS